MSELCYLSATEALRLFAQRKLSPVELTRAVIERADKVEPHINAFSDRYYDQALEQARAAETVYLRDPAAARPLEGIPVATKEEHAIAGLSHRRGSLVYKDNVATESVPVAERVLRAGGIVHARTTTPEFSMPGFTHSRLWGITRNPWNLEYSSGGSSGGAGASLAAGSATLVTGSDIGGSIRGPASCNGVFGFRPPYGRVPSLPPINFDHYFVSGPLARTVDDLALLQNVLAGPDRRDIVSLRPKLELPSKLEDVAGLRVALSSDLGAYRVDREVVDSTRAAAGALSAAGATVEEVDLRITPEETRLCIFIHFNSIFGGSVKKQLDESREMLSDPAIDFIELGLKSAARYSYLEGLMMEADIYRRLSTVLDQYDVLVCPTTVIPALTAGESYRTHGPVACGTTLEHWVDYYLTCPFSITARCPVIAAPAGIASTGVPIGVQIVGRTYDDVTVFRVAKMLERAHPWTAYERGWPVLT